MGIENGMHRGKHERHMEMKLLAAKLLARGKTRPQVAEIVGVSAQSIKNWFTNSVYFQETYSRCRKSELKKLEEQIDGQLEVEGMKINIIRKGLLNNVITSVEVIKENLEDEEAVMSDVEKAIRLNTDLAKVYAAPKETISPKGGNGNDNGETDKLINDVDNIANSDNSTETDVEVDSQD